MARRQGGACGSEGSADVRQACNSRRLQNPFLTADLAHKVAVAQVEERWTSQIERSPVRIRAAGLLLIASLAVRVWSAYGYYTLQIVHLP